MNQEDNILIAEFMGYVVSHPMESVCGFVDDVEYFPLLDLKYDRSWDWLMSVTQECYKKADGEEFNEIVDAVSILNLDATFTAVVKFIKLYNKQINEQDNFNIKKL